MTTSRAPEKKLPSLKQECKKSMFQALPVSQISAEPPPFASKRHAEVHTT